MYVHMEVGVYVCVGPACCHSSKQHTRFPRKIKDRKMRNVVCLLLLVVQLDAQGRDGKAGCRAPVDPITGGQMRLVVVCLEHLCERLIESVSAFLIVESPVVVSMGF